VEKEEKGVIDACKGGVARRRRRGVGLCGK